MKRFYPAGRRRPYSAPPANRAALAQNTNASPNAVPAAPKARQPELALQLAHWGVTRVCPVGRMQDPPLTWRHDGRPALGDLITWTDWERED